MKPSLIEVLFVESHTAARIFAFVAQSDVCCVSHYWSFCAVSFSFILMIVYHLAWNQEQLFISMCPVTPML